MKLICSLVFLGVLLVGCATGTVESRRKQRLVAYQALPAETKAMVDKGQIQKGMSEEAVFIAWGAPAQILHKDDEHGPATIWQYQGVSMQEIQRWKVRVVGNFLERYSDREYVPRDYIRAEITMTNGVVASWRTLPEPLH